MGAAPFQGVQTLTQTCPDSAPSGGPGGAFDDPLDPPFSAPSWAELAPGEIRFSDAAGKTIAPGGGNPAVGQAYDPIGGDGACAAAPSGEAPGTASYRLDPAPAGGFTLMGSPTIIIDINSQGPTSQLAARLVDVPPGGGDATLVARGLYRPEINVGSTPTRQVFQLHPNGWHFDDGHIAKLELIPNDTPYGRASNGQAPITVSNLELRLPVVEAVNPPLIQSPAPKVLPAGYALATDFLAGGSVTIGGDNDRDGIPNSQDACPNQIGPASNSGCPPSNAAAANPEVVKTCKKRTKGKKASAAKKRKRCKGKKKQKKKR
jgi:hypothetical protein